MWLRLVLVALLSIGLTSFAESSDGTYGPAYGSLKAKGHESQKNIALAIAPGVRVFGISEPGDNLNFYGVSGTLYFYANRNAMIGVESGLYLNEFNTPTRAGIGRASVYSVPLYLSFRYDFLMDYPIRPYFGVLAGASFNSLKLRLTAPNGTQALFYEDNEIDFEGFARVGFAFGLSDSVSLFVEPRLGLVFESSTLVFQAQGGLLISL